MDPMSATKERIKELEDKYENLVAMTLKAVNLQSPSISDFRNKITLRLPQSIKLQQSLKENLPYIYNATSIEEIFGVFNLGVWNYLNYGLLQHLVEVYGDSEMKDMMREYATSVEVFRKETPLKVFWEASPNGDCPNVSSNLRRDLLKITFKHGNLNPTTTLEEIEQFRQVLTHKFTLPEFVMILAHIEKGCVATIWFVPPSVAAILKDENQRTEFFEHHHILEMKIEDSTIYCSGKNHEIDALVF